MTDDSADYSSGDYPSIEDAVAALADSQELPVEAVAICTVRYSESGPLLRAALARGADGEITTEEEAQLLFRSLFIIGARRDPLGFEPLLRLLRLPEEDVEWLLGDAITDALPCIVAGVFDGNAEALLAAVLDLEIEQFVRLALFDAATFLTWDERIERNRMTAFLDQFYHERGAPDMDATWMGWLRSIALLGLRPLAPAVQRILDDDEVLSEMLDDGEFEEMLERAEQAPDDIERFKDEGLGYIEDVIEALERFPDIDDDEYDALDEDALDEDEAEEGRGFMDTPLPSEPVVNPWRNVGRNDPCPCGSGKKAKRCCLAA